MLVLLVAFVQDATAAPRPVTVAGWAHISAGLPLEGARVELRTLGGRLLTTQGRPITTANGTFGFNAERLPRRYVIVVRGGYAGGQRFEETLETIVVGGARFRLAHVNLATTLAARYSLHHPQEGWSNVLRRVRRYLELPDGVTLEASLRRSSRHFDGARFLAAAMKKNGSLAAFVVRLEREIERGRRRPFGGRDEHPTTVSGRALAASFQITPAGLLTAAVNGAVSALAGDGVGWLLGAIGFGQQSSEQPDEIANVVSQLQTMQATLTQIETQLSSVEGQIKQLEASVAQSEYTQLASQLAQLDGVGSATDNVLTDLDYITDHALATCTPSGDCVSPIPAGDDPLVWCETSVAQKAPLQAAACDALRTISTSYQPQAESTLANVLQGVNGADGLIVAFQKVRSAAIVAASGFVTPAYGADASTVLGYYAWKQALLGSYYAEYGHAEGLPTLQTTLEGYQADLTAEQALLPPQLPDATFVDTRTGLMWALVDFTNVTNPTYKPGPVTSWESTVGACVFPDQSPYLWDYVHPFYEQADYTQAETQDCVAAYVGVTGGAESGYLGYRWTMPELWNVQAMIAGWSGSTVAAWLTAQAGLPDLSAVASYPVPAPDPSLFPSTVVTDGVYYPNPGTALGVTDLTTCEFTGWDAGTYDTSDDFPVSVLGEFCKYLRLTDGSIGFQCVAADPSSDYPCHMPVLVNPVPGEWGDDGPLDFGHPGILFVVRTPASGEAWYRS